MRNLAVVTSWQRPIILAPSKNNSNLYNFNMTIYKAWEGSVCHVVAIGRIDRRQATPRR
jgi:hypothetical protein